MKIVLFGCGALGSQIAYHLARPDRELVLVDDDVIERGNVESGTTYYHGYQVGYRKVIALAEEIYRLRGCVTHAVHKTVTPDNVLVIASGADFALDLFDNIEARKLVARLGIRALHAGVGDANNGLVAWGDGYPLPAQYAPRGENPLCTRQLGARILAMTSMFAAASAEEYMASGRRNNYLVGVNNATLL